MKRLILIVLTLICVKVCAQKTITGTYITNKSIGYSKLEWSISYRVFVTGGEGKGAIRLEYSNHKVSPPSDAYYAGSDGNFNPSGNKYYASDLGFSEWPEEYTQSFFKGTLNIYYKGQLLRTLPSSFINGFTLGTFFGSGSGDNIVYKAKVGETFIPFDSFNAEDITATFTNVSTTACPGCDKVSKRIREIESALKEKPAESKEVVIGFGRGSQSSGNDLDTNKTSGSSKSGNDDYWGTSGNNNTKAQTANSGQKSGRQAGIPADAPPMVMDNAGNYYVQDTTGEYVKTTKEQYDRVKKDYNAEKNRAATTAANDKNARAEQDAINKFNESQDKFARDMEARKAKNERDGRLLANSFYTAQALSSAKSGMKELSNLQGTFESVEELNAVFNQQYAAISQQEDQLTEAGRNNISAGMDYAFKDADANTAAYKGLATSVGTALSDAAAERRAREAREELQRQRAAQERAIEERKWQALLTIRRGMLEKFPDGGVPLSFHKVPPGDLHFFAYAIAPDAINEKNPVVFVSNVFVVQHYSDGSWPFKKNMVAEIKKIVGSDNIVLVGYYTNPDDAVQMQEGFVGLARKSQMIVKDFTYKGKKSSGGSGTADFWGGEANKTKDAANKTTGTPAPATPAKSADDDFWDNSKKKEAAKPAGEEKKKDDFWD